MPCRSPSSKNPNRPETPGTGEGLSGTLFFFVKLVFEIAVALQTRTSDRFLRCISLVFAKSSKHAQNQD